MGFIERTPVDYKGRQFKTLLGSDIHKDGMFLELYEADSHKPLMEVFYSDVDGSFSISGFGDSIPLEIVEQFLAAARHRLPPSPDA